MEQNIFQVIKEDHLDEILSNYMQNLVLVMLSSKTCGPCKIIKPKFVEALPNQSVLFSKWLKISTPKIQNQILDFRG